MLFKTKKTEPEAIDMERMDSNINHLRILYEIAKDDIKNYQDMIARRDEEIERLKAELEAIKAR